MMKNYRKYQHVEKIGSSDVEGIEIGTCYIFPKIDGTNAHLWIDDGKLKAGSRNRQLSLDSDNAGFCEWALNNPYIYILMNRLSEQWNNCHVYGEWLVPHTLKTYEKEAWNRFYIFDVVKEEGTHVQYEEYKEILDQIGYEDYIHPLRIIKHPKLDNLYKCLDENKYLIKDGDGIGEGIVIKNYQFVNKYGRQTWAKLVSSDFKSKHIKEMGAPVSSGTKHIEESIVDYFLTDDIIDKVYANIVNECGWSNKHIPRLLSSVYHDLVKEHSWDFVKKFKNPTVDYKKLNLFCINRMKEYKPELF